MDREKTAFTPGVVRRILVGSSAWHTHTAAHAYRYINAQNSRAANGTITTRDESIALIIANAGQTACGERLCVCLIMTSKRAFWTRLIETQDENAEC